jgi:DNA replication protein DnaC
MREEPLGKAKPFDIPKRIVWEAYWRVKANRGAAGVDDQSIEAFDRCVKNNLFKLWNRLSSGSSVAFFTAAGLVHQLMEARDERRLLKLQAQLAAVKLLIVDELGYVPLSQTGAELLFEIFSQRHERSSTIVTSNLPFEEWTSVFGNQRLTGALLDRLTHHVHILELNGESYRLKLIL